MAMKGTRNFVPALTALVILAVGLIGYWIWWANQGTPHERFLAEVERELSLVETVQGRLNITLQGVTLGQELWVQRPNLLRTETETGPSGFAGTIVMLNAAEGWVYSPALARATVVDRAAYSADLAGEAGAGSLLERMPDQILATLQSGASYNLGDTTTVAGRAATILELIIPPGDAEFPAGPLTVWLDNQYSYPLAWRDANGRELRFNAITFNVEIDPATFTFFPPPGAAVNRIEPTPIPSGATN